eukprot:m.26322 g.26322  ORF g.26322 m.26322 type:complete len:430 (+) comp11722_c0_seq1:332-1621(+)
MSSCNTPIRYPNGYHVGAHNTPPRPFKRIKSRTKPVLRPVQEGKPWIYQKECKTWFQSVDGSSASRDLLGEEGFLVLTYNVWMAKAHQESRWAAIFSIVERANSHVVCFQEATSAFVTALKQQSWVQKRYVFSHGAFAGEEEYGPMLLVRRGLGCANVVEFELPGNLCRSVLSSTIEVGGAKVTVVTTHLESNKSNTEQRVNQLHVIQNALLFSLEDSASRPHGHVVFMGDMNFDYLSDEQDTLDPRWIDCWSEGGDGSKGFTVNTKTNLMLQASKKDRTLQVRYDRIFVVPPHRSSKRLMCAECHLIGTEEIDVADDGVGAAAAAAVVVFPSDHYGLAAKLTLSFAPPPRPLSSAGADAAPHSSLIPHSLLICSADEALDSSDDADCDGEGPDSLSADEFADADPATRTDCDVAEWLFRAVPHPGVNF